jgi:Sulfotransferase family
MSVLVGGCGSSGSTLLRSYLNRHPQMFCGSEMGFFNKDIVYKDWGRFSSLYLSCREKTISTNGWFPYPGVLLTNGDYAYCRGEVDSFVAESRDVVEFSELYFSKFVEPTGALLWAEKTPSNSYCFQYFLDVFSNGKVIHIMRDPYDTVASLVRRGMTPFFASALYWFNNLSALSVNNLNSYCLIKYEDLVGDPEIVFSKIFNFLQLSKVDFVDILESKGDHYEREKKKSWRFSPDGEIRQSDISSFDKLCAEEKLMVIDSLEAIKISLWGEAGTLEEFCMDFGYHYRGVPKKYFLVGRYKDMFQDRLKRILKGYFGAGSDYPVKFR